MAAIQTDFVIDHVSARRLLRRVEPSSMAVNAFRALIDTLRESINWTDDQIGPDCGYVVVCSTQADCEYLEGPARVMVLDTAVFDLLHAVNALNAVRPGDRAHLAIAGELLGTAALEAGDWAPALFCADLRDRFRPDQQRLMHDFRADQALLFFQLVFAVLHEANHHAFQANPSFRQAASIRYDALRDGAERHINHLFDADNIARLVREAGMDASPSPSLDEFRHNARSWLYRREEEVLCDFLALRTMLRNLPNPAMAGTVLFAAASLPWVLELRARASAQRRGAAPEAAAARRAGRSFASSAIGHAATLETGTRYDADDLRRKTLDYLQYGVGAVEAGLDQVRSNLETVRHRGAFKELEANHADAERAARESFGVLPAAEIASGMLWL